MNIFFRKIRWKNLLSTGNSFTEIDLAQHQTTLIVGENGAGKSTLLDALCFVLFNKPFRKINKPQLINSITRSLLVVEVEFSVKGSEYKIVRGMKPNVFEIWKNGELITQDAASRDYQSHLEKQILRTNYKTFCQIVILGSASFVPFMQLPSGQRREITEDVLDLQIFTLMNSLLKDKIYTNDKFVLEIDKEKNIADERLTLVRLHAEQMVQEKEKQIESKNEKIELLHGDIEDTQVEIAAILQQVASYQNDTKDFAKVQKKSNTIKKLEAQLSAKIDGLEREIKFLKNNTACPTCAQEIDPEFCVHTTEDKTTSITETKDGLKLLKKEVEEVNARLDAIEAINKAINEENTKIFVLNTRLVGWENQVKELEREISTLEEGRAALVDEGSVPQLESIVAELAVKRGELVTDQHMMNYIAVLLKDSGIKARIIKQYIPVINKLINKYLAALDFFVDFNLDENFEETIRARHRDDFAYNSFSEGEKMRIDLAVLFAWRAVSKLRSSVNTNLLIMDEVFDGSLDSSGTEEFMKILGKLTEENNVFIISHKTDQLWDKFEKVIKFEKVKNFSKAAT